MAVNKALTYMNVNESMRAIDFVPSKIGFIIVDTVRFGTGSRSSLETRRYSNVAPVFQAGHTIKVVAFIQGFILQPGSPFALDLWTQGINYTHYYVGINTTANNLITDVTYSRLAWDQTRLN